MPRKSAGQFLRIRIVSNYGDKHYVGLNGLQVFDTDETPLLSPSKQTFKLYADPAMSASSTGLEDKRVPENLYNGINTGESFDKYFLMPYVNPRRLDHPSNLNKEFSQILIFFEDHYQIGKITFWNYSKTFSRATKEIEIFLDESIIFSVSGSKAGSSSQSLEVSW